MIKELKVNSSNHFLKKTEAREYAFKFLYKHLMPDFRDEKTALLDNSTFEKAIDLFNQSYFESDAEHPHMNLDAGSIRFAKTLLVETLKNETEYKNLILPLLQNKNIDKMDPLNLAILLLGIHEMKSTKDTSSAVFINEYVNIAKKYGTLDTGGFVNSILDKIAKHG